MSYRGKTVNINLSVIQYLERKFRKINVHGQTFVQVFGFQEGKKEATWRTVSPCRNYEVQIIN